jgi:UDP-N-acetyl-D-glucosamine dehydrogenase
VTSDRVETLEDKLSTGAARTAVIGMGYVGLPLAVEIAKAGHPVVGLDVAAEKVDLINAGTSYIPDVPAAELAPLVAKGLLTASMDFDELATVDAAVICVPSPLNKMKEPDISYIVAATDAIAARLHPGMLVVLESTTYPGTTEEEVLPRLAASGLEVGRDFFVAFSPERVDPGNPVYKTKNTAKVVGGVTPECGRLARRFYERFIDQVIMVSTPRAAEMTKLLENIFRCVNIALVNELLVLGDRMDINMWEVVDAAKTKPFGFMPFYPGPGLGGHCIPIDPFYLAWKARQYDSHTEFIELAGKINEQMPYWVVERVAEALNDHAKPVKGTTVLVLGVAYKKDIDDVRESPAVRIIEGLEERGAKVLYHDPHVPHFKEDGLDMSSVALTPELVRGCDAVVVVTDHSSVDYDMILAESPLVVDTRNALSGRSASGNVYLL